MKQLCISCINFNAKINGCKKFANVNIITGRYTYSKISEIREKKCGIEKPIYFVPILDKLEKNNTWLNHLKSLDSKYNLFTQDILIIFGSIFGIVGPNLLSNIINIPEIFNEKSIGTIIIATCAINGTNSLINAFETILTVNKQMKITTDRINAIKKNMNKYE